MEGWERINEIIKREGMNKTSFSVRIGLTNNVTITRLINEKRTPSKMTCEKIVQAFPQYNFDWVYNGKGNMLNDETQALAQISPINIPLLPQSAQAGSLNDFMLSTCKEDCEQIISPIKDVDFAMTVCGDSMAPEYPNGSRILIKKINEKAFVEWGKVYVLDTCNGSVIKRIVPADENSKIRCLSINTDPIYAPFDVEWKDIYGVYKVLLCMSIK